MTAIDAVHGTLAIVVIICIGFTLLRWVSELSWTSSWPVRLALAHLVGAAALTWVVTVLAVPADRLRIIPVYCLLLSIALVTWKWRGFSPSARERVTPQPVCLWESAWKYIAIATVVMTVVLTGSSLSSPGNLTTDAHWNWVLKAKAIFLFGSLRPVFEGFITKPDYPILFPLQVTWIYWHIGHVQEWWAQLTGFLFYLDLLVIAYAGCRAFMSAAWAWTATAIVIGDPIYMFFATRGQPDVIVSAYLLASSLFLAQYLRDRETGARTLALLMLLGAAQTKNEGISWAAFATVILLLYELRWGKSLRAIGTAATMLCAVLPWIIIERLHTVQYGAEEPMATAHALHTEFLHRIKTILVAHFSGYRPYSFNFLIVLCLPLLWLGWKKVSKPVLALIGAQLFAYFMIYFLVADQVYQLDFMTRALSDIAPALLVTCIIGYQRWVASQRVQSDLLSTASTLP